MIKVSFRSVNALDDVCEMLESKITDQKEVEKWIEESVPDVFFDCMDFPHDSEAFYDCYFLSDAEEQNAKKIYDILKQRIENKVFVEFAVFVVDDKLELVQKIEGETK